MEGAPSSALNSDNSSVSYRDVELFDLRLVAVTASNGNPPMTVEVAMRLGVNPKHADQMVRGTVILPHGLGGTSKRVLVIAVGEKATEAEAGKDWWGTGRNWMKTSELLTGSRLPVRT